MFRSMLFCVGLAFVPSGLGAQDAPRAGVKEDFKQAGRDVGHGAKQVGHGVKRGAKEVGQGVKRGAKEVGRGFKRAVGKD